MTAPTAPRVAGMPAAESRGTAATRGGLLVADITVLLVVVVIATLVGLSIGIPRNPLALGRNIELFSLFAGLSVLRLGMAGQYEQGRRYMRLDDFLVVLRATLGAACVTITLAVITDGFFSDLNRYHRPFIAAVLAALVMSLMLVRVAGHARQGRAFADGRNIATNLVLGEGSRAERFTEWLSRNGYLGFRGVLARDMSWDDVPAFEQELAEMFEQLRPAEVTLAFDRAQPDLQVAVVREAAYRGIAVKTLPGVFESYQSSYFDYGGVPVTTLFQTPRQRFARQLKVAIDRTAAITGLVVLAPALALVALAIKLDDGGPVFYRQERVGLHGRRFRVWKFRSMRTDAHEALEAFLDAHPERRLEWEVYQKLQDDPRETRFGRFIRTWSIDELPQLINVALGEMSLVGPRPPMASQIDSYGLRFVFSQARPGITGLWQVSGRNEVSFDGRVDLEVYYVENWSLGLDLLILLKTVMVVIRRTGAPSHESSAFRPARDMG